MDWAVNENLKDISELLVNMTKNGATYDEIRAVVEHSITVLDMEKAKQNAYESYIEHHIDQFREKYCGTCAPKVPRSPT